MIWLSFVVEQNLFHVSLIQSEIVFEYHIGARYIDRFDSDILC